MKPTDIINGTENEPLDTEKEKIKQSIEAWKNAGPVLEEERRKRIREADTRAFIEMTAGMVHAYLARNGSRDSSGLVEQQRYFRKMNRA